MPHQLTTKDKQVVDETLPHPKQLHWWQKLGAQITLAIGTLFGRKGGG